jgi:hypothetical protein
VVKVLLRSLEVEGPMIDRVSATLALGANVPASVSIDGELAIDPGPFVSSYWSVPGVELDTSVHGVPPSNGVAFVADTSTPSDVFPLFVSCTDGAEHVPFGKPSELGEEPPLVEEPPEQFPNWTDDALSVTDLNGTPAALTGIVAFRLDVGVPGVTTLILTAAPGGMKQAPPGFTNSTAKLPTVPNV